MITLCCPRYDYPVMNLGADAKMKTVTGGWGIISGGPMSKGDTATGTHITSVRRVTGTAPTTRFHVVVQAICNAETKKHYELVFKVMFELSGKLRATNPGPRRTFVFRVFISSYSSLRFD